MANPQDPRKSDSPGSVNEKLQDRIIRHLLYLTRLSTREARRIVGQMDSEVLPALEDRIVAAVNRLQGLGGGRTNLISARQQRFLQGFAGQLSETTTSLMSGVRENLMGRIVEIAGAEVDFEQRLIGKSLPVEWTFSTPSNQQLESIMRAQPFDGKPMSEWFDDLEAGTVSKVTQAIRQGMIEGEGIPQIMQRIRGTRAGAFTDGVLGTTRQHAEALARSGVIFASDQATSEFYRQNDDLIKEVRWVLTLDNRTCLRCVDKENNSPYKLDEAPVAPVHPNCRCTKAPVTKSWRELGIDLDEAPPGTRASMNGQVPDSMTYNEWLSKQDLDVVKEALGEKRALLFKEGKLSVTSFTDRQGRQLTLEQIRQKERDVFEELGIELN